MGEATGTLASFPDLRNILRQWVARAKRLEEELGVSVDDSQEVVEVVGDATRQPADGLHLERLAQLLFTVAQCLLCLQSAAALAGQLFGPLLYPSLQLSMCRFQRIVLPLNLFQHPVESLGKYPQLVIALVRSSGGVVLVARHSLG